MSAKKQGFAAIGKRKHREYSSKGGSAKVPKGFATMSPEARSKNGKYASDVRWTNHRLQKQAMGKPINS